MNSKLKKPFMADKEPENEKMRELTCPHREEILELKGLPGAIEKMAEQQNDIFNRLFVQNGDNKGVDCLSVQIQKNTTARVHVEKMKDDERRNKWRRRGFYAAIIGIFISNMFLIIHEFLI